jgi:outer membrane protein OmpA-like peptidoglycan-associated protein
MRILEGWLLLALLPVGLAAPARAQAQEEPWLVSVDGALQLPLVAPTRERFGPGPRVSVGVFRALGEAFLLGARLGGGFLTDGPAPSDPRVVDPGVGDLYDLSIAARLRPLAGLTGGDERGTGLFVEIDAGAALTGGLLRPQVAAGVGYGFALGDVDLAPVVRWQTVFEVDNQLDARPANLLSVGLEVVFGDRRTPPPIFDLPDEPLSDRDGDGLHDGVDGCPDDPEDVDGFEDADGCPDPDNDGDGIGDGEDDCPLRPEDFDGFADADGCPDPDNDGDGLLDADDACPTEAEVVNGVDDEDGCPDEGLIEMVDDRVVLEERILFDFDRVRLRPSARPVLLAVVALYEQHAEEWTRLRIEGHADRRGTEERNLYVSTLRARVVRDQLVRFGIPSGIIDFVGFAARRPESPGRTEDDHAHDRRVEFVVLPRSPAPGDGAPDGARDAVTAPSPEAPAPPESESPPGLEPEPDGAVEPSPLPLAQALAEGTP